MGHNLVRSAQICVLLIALVFGATSCGSSKKISFVTSTVVPGAEGTVKVKKDKNQNYLVEITIENLATPRQLTPPRDSYVAWMETKQNGTMNIGQVHSSKGMFSKTRRASLTTVSTFKPLRIFITAEEDPKIESPGTMVIMTTDAF
jgi:hypothetical protein